MKGNPLTKTGVYIHVPFCDHKCIYCDFYSIIKLDNRKRFIEAVQREIENYSSIYKNDREIVTVFFGGGTPSLMELSELGLLMNRLYKSFNVSSSAEITMETNPGTVDSSKLKAFKDIGINRLSIGIQSFNDEELKFLTRIHDKKTALQTVNDAYENGFENINIDLIFNLPGQSMQKWSDNLKVAVDLPIKHISSYSLILEPGTILNKKVLEGKVSMQEEEIDADLYEKTIDFLIEKGFNQYEISNFAKTGYECLHNKIYWQHDDYLGFGPSAHSFVNNKRWWNYSALHRYLKELEENNSAVSRDEIITKEQSYDEEIMLSLRCGQLDFDNIEKVYGKDLYHQKKQYIDSLVVQDYCVLEKRELKLTKKGFLFCDEIILNLLK